MQPGIHKDRIMDIEFTVYNGVQVYFTCSLDGTVKAWQVGQDQKSLVIMGEMPMGSKVSYMQMATPNFLLAGLENGNLAGWDLNANKVD